MRLSRLPLFHSGSAYFVGLLGVISCVIGMVIAKAELELSVLVGVLLLLALVVAVYARPSVSLFVFLVIWPVYVVLNQFFSLDSLPEARMWQEALILLSVLGVLFRILVKRIRIASFERLDWITLLLFLMSVYGSVLSRSWELIIYGFHLTYAPILMYFLVRLLPLRVAYVRLWLGVLLGICLLIALTGLYIQLTDPGAYYRLVLPADELGAIARRGSFRMGSIFANPLYFGLLMSIAAILSVIPFGNTRSRWYRLAMFLIFTVCTVLSLTRGAVVSLLSGITVILVCYFRLSRSHKYALWLTVPLLGVFLVGIVFSPAQSAVVSFFSDSQGGLFAGRTSQWQQAWDSIIQALWGHGLGVGNAMLRANQPSVAIMDGWYLKVLAEGGVIGLVVFIMFMVGTLLFLVSRVRAATGTDSAYWLYSGVLAIFVGYSLAAIGSNVWDYYMTPSVMWILIGFAVTVIDGSHTNSLPRWHTETSDGDSRASHAVSLPRLAKR